MTYLDYKVEIVKLSEDDGGGYFAKVPRLPGCISDGETPEEALINIQDAIQAWIDTAKELSRTIPAPEEYDSEKDQFSGKLLLRMPKYLHKRLAEKASEEEVSINQLILSYLSFGLGFEEDVNSLLDNTRKKIKTLAIQAVNSDWRGSNSNKQIRYWPSHLEDRSLYND